MRSHSKIFVVIDEGCQECGVPSIPIGSYTTRGGAEKVADRINDEQNGWRNGGEAWAMVHEVRVPRGKLLVSARR
ncbi:MAG: hypothetical protein KJN71_09495 [Acidimicrobiia bacterium]|nr:hypothetical protein [Acidimicrobiia bacterium]